MEKIRKHLWISGRVQGVSFRANTIRRAKILGVSGWVRNLPNGKVETIIEGPKNKVNKLVKWCREGPRLASVEKVEVKEEPYTGEVEGFRRLN